MAENHLVFSTETASGSSRFFKKAAELKYQRMSEMTVEEQRSSHARLMQSRPIPPGVELLDTGPEGVRCEWVLRPENYSEKIIVYFHGGGWKLGCLEDSRPAAVLLAEFTPYKILNVEYRLSPEFPYPAALDDCEAVWRWLLDQGYRPGNMALFGDSAGGNLALALIHRLRRLRVPLPCALGLASPVTDLSETSEIVRTMPPVATLMHEGSLRDIFSLYAPGADRSDPELSPVMGALGGFPPMLLHVGGDEALLLDCAAFAKKAARQGADALCKVYREMFHDFSVVGITLKESRRSLGEFADFFERHLGEGAARRLHEIR